MVTVALDVSSRSKGKKREEVALTIFICTQKSKLSEEKSHLPGGKRSGGKGKKQTLMIPPLGWPHCCLERNWVLLGRENGGK